LPYGGNGLPPWNLVYHGTSLALASVLFRNVADGTMIISPSVPPGPSQAPGPTTRRQRLTSTVSIERSDTSVM
jgi:hypothetical protein